MNKEFLEKPYVKCCDCKFFRNTKLGMSCKFFGNPWDVDLTDGYGCSQFFESKYDSER